MFPEARSVRHIRDYEIEVTFANGEKRVVPLWDEVVNKPGPMVQPLRDVKFFAKVFVNPEGGNLEWPNGYDICPDVLYWLATGTPITFSTDPKYHRPPPHLQKRRRSPARPTRAKQPAKR